MSEASNLFKGHGDKLPPRYVSFESCSAASRNEIQLVASIRIRAGDGFVPVRIESGPPILQVLHRPIRRQVRAAIMVTPEFLAAGFHAQAEGPYFPFVCRIQCQHHVKSHFLLLGSKTINKSKHDNCPKTQEKAVSSPDLDGHPDHPASRTDNACSVAPHQRPRNLGSAVGALTVF